MWFPFTKIRMGGADMLNNIHTQTLRGKLLKDYNLAKHTSWHVGGKAEQVYIPQDVDDLSYFLSTLSEAEPVYFLGLGSNVLIRDGGLPGTVIMTLDGLSDISESESLHRVEAGVPCPKVAKHTVKEGYTGAEFFAGIPGTIGGALEMNAGAFGGETWDIIEKVELIKKDGTRYFKDKSEYEVNYRQVKGRADTEWFVAAYFKLAKDDDGQGKSIIKELLAKRKYSQPIGQFSCGSVFKNPKPHFAAELIERSGLKGFSIGDAAVSEKHANFIINLGNATASDLEAVMSHVQATVKADYDIDLIPEVRILGRAEGQQEESHE